MPLIKEPEVQKSLRELLDPNWGKRPKPIRSILPCKKYNYSDRFERKLAKDAINTNPFLDANNSTTIMTSVTP